MTSADHHDCAKLTALGAGALFVGDLFMTWERTVVRVPGAVDVHTSASGWTGWGLVAGILGLVVMGLIGARVEHPRGLLLAAAGMLSATALSILVGSADVHMMMMPGIGVEHDTTRWPAWLGLALAAVTTAACVDGYRTCPRIATPRRGSLTPPTPA